jgi:outer membrane lipoprotein-sorting protein
MAKLKALILITILNNSSLPTLALAKTATAKTATAKTATAKTATAKTAIEKVMHSEFQSQGDSMSALVSMSVEHDNAKRDLKFRIWQIGHDKALIKILTPTKDKDTGSLRIKFDLWQYLPNVSRVIRIPSSMMLQSWMGSDFTNDDLVKASSQSRDYTHTIEGEDKIGDETVVKIICTPKPDAPVVWGKIRLWLRAKDDVPLRQEFFNEHGDLLKRLDGSDVKTIGKHNFPTHLVMFNLSKPGNKTIMDFSEVKFDENISEAVFTQENLKKSNN